MTPLMLAKSLKPASLDAVEKIFELFADD